MNLKILQKPEIVCLCVFLTFWWPFRVLLIYPTDLSSAHANYVKTSEYKSIH